MNLRISISWLRFILIWARNCVYSFIVWDPCRLKLLLHRCWCCSWIRLIMRLHLFNQYCYLRRRYWALNHSRTTAFDNSLKVWVFWGTSFHRSNLRFICCRRLRLTWKLVVSLTFIIRILTTFSTLYWLLFCMWFFGNIWTWLICRWSTSKVSFVKNSFNFLKHCQI